MESERILSAHQKYLTEFRLYVDWNPFWIFHQKFEPLVCNLLCTQLWIRIQYTSSHSRKSEHSSEIELSLLEEIAESLLQRISQNIATDAFCLFQVDVFVWAFFPSAAVVICGVSDVSVTIPLHLLNKQSKKYNMKTCSRLFVFRFNSFHS